MLEVISDEFDTVDQSREVASVWSEVIQDEKGGRGGDSIYDGGRRTNSSDTLHGDSQELDATRNNERMRSPPKTKEEYAEILRKFKELYAYSRTKNSNGKNRPRSR